MVRVGFLHCWRREKGTLPWGSYPLARIATDLSCLLGGSAARKIIFRGKFLMAGFEVTRNRQVLGEPPGGESGAACSGYGDDMLA